MTRVTPNQRSVAATAGAESPDEQYLKEMLDTAIAGLNGKVCPRRVVMIREVLVELLRTDPVLVELRRRAQCSLEARSARAANRAERVAR